MPGSPVAAETARPSARAASLPPAAWCSGSPYTGHRGRNHGSGRQLIHRSLPRSPFPARRSQHQSAGYRRPASRECGGRTSPSRTRYTPTRPESGRIGDVRHPAAVRRGRAEDAGPAAIRHARRDHPGAVVRGRLRPDRAPPTPRSRISRSTVPIAPPPRPPCSIPAIPFAPRKPPGPSRLSTRSLSSLLQHGITGFPCRRLSLAFLPEVIRRHGKTQDRTDRLDAQPVRVRVNELD